MTVKAINVFASIFVSFGAFTVNGWMVRIEFALNESDRHVVLQHFEVGNTCECKEKTYCGERSYWSVILEVVKTLDLRMAFGYES